MDPLNREGTTDFDEAQLTADELEGINVYGTNDEHIGSIGDLALNVAARPTLVQYIVGLD